jgi:hypothetical protein
MGPKMLPRTFSSFLKNGLYVVNFNRYFCCGKRWLLISSRSVMMVMMMRISLDMMVVVND